MFEVIHAGAAQLTVTPCGAAYDLLVAKSGYHFKLSFAGLATPLFVDTPGLTNWRPGFFQYRHARPFYPEDDIGLGPITAQLFP